MITRNEIFFLFFLVLVLISACWHSLSSQIFRTENSTAIRINELNKTFLEDKCNLNTNSPQVDSIKFQVSKDGVNWFQTLPAPQLFRSVKYIDGYVVYGKTTKISEAK